MLMLICQCGHSGPFPEDSTRLVCSKCQQVHQVQWVGTSRGGLDPITMWRLSNPLAPSYRIEWVSSATLSTERVRGRQASASPLISPSFSPASSRNGAPSPSRRGGAEASKIFVTSQTVSEKSTAMDDGVVR